MKFYKVFPGLMVGLLLSASFLISSCEKDPETTPLESADQVINSNPDLSLFKAALARTGMTMFTQGGGPFTFIAPTNAAFNAIGITSEAQINAADSTLLVNILTYHVINGRRLSVEIPVGPNAPITTQGGLSLYASKNTNGIFLNGAKLVSPDIQVSNGVVHISNEVLLPPLVNALQALQVNPDYKLFVQAITKAAVTTSFTANPSTVFAVNNAAMIAGGYDSTTIANTAAATLSPIMRYHVANIRRFSSEMVNGPIKMVQGTNVEISANGTKIKGTTNAAPFNITANDFIVTNGVIHFIDGVLKP